MDCSLPGSAVHGILQARTLEWVAIASSRENLADPGTEPMFLMSPTLADGFSTSVIWEETLLNLQKADADQGEGCYFSIYSSIHSFNKLTECQVLC